MNNEVRATDPSTGAQKGRKPQEFSLVPWRSVAAISEVYHYGAKKYTRHNWRGGYPWSWSYDALQRHIQAWWEGEDTDPESGLSHLAHAGFHVLSLLYYSILRKGTDDRFIEPDEKNVLQRPFVGSVSVGHEIRNPYQNSGPLPMGGISGMENQQVRPKGLGD